MTRPVSWVGQTICELVYEADSWNGYPTPADIRYVSFRRGLGEIDVVYGRSDDSGTGDVTVSIPSEPVLSELLRRMLVTEREEA